MRTLVFFLSMVGAACGGAPVEVGLDEGAGGKADAPLGNFHVVAPGIYRGARPDAAGLRRLAALGVKTIIDLDNDVDVVDGEARAAAGLGMKVEREPMSWLFAPEDAQMQRILALLANSRQRPLFVHCQYGEDRTGLVIGLYRVFRQGWKPTTAYQEMLRRGFHPTLVALDHYYKEKTGMED